MGESKGDPIEKLEETVFNLLETQLKLQESMQDLAARVTTLEAKMTPTQEPNPNHNPGMNVTEVTSAAVKRAIDQELKVDQGSNSDVGEKNPLLDLNITRSQTTWEVLDRDLTVALLKQSKGLQFGLCDQYKEPNNQCPVFIKGLLLKNNEDAHSLSKALKLLKMFISE